MSKLYFQNQAFRDQYIDDHKLKNYGKYAKRGLELRLNDFSDVTFVPSRGEIKTYKTVYILEILE